uniref:hypothetical protein n=1 Tax=Mucilaginibacter ximonensis TaxID=538021 RepID=UPI00366F2239
EVFSMSSERTQGQSLRHFAARFREPAAGKQRRPANHAVSTAVVLAVVVAVAYSAISITPATAATRFADAWTSAIEPGITAGSRVTSEVACYNTTLKITASSSEQDKDDALSAVRCLLNNERLAWDLPDLTPFAMLDEAARVHNAWMAGTHVFDHLETGAGSLPTPPDR